MFSKYLLDVVFYEGVSTACDSATITSVVSKWRVREKNRADEGQESCFWLNSLMEKEVQDSVLS
jgi:hypothetical protein